MTENVSVHLYFFLINLCIAPNVAFTFKKNYKLSDTSVLPTSTLTANMDTISQLIKNDLSVAENYATSEDNSRNLKNATSAPFSDNIKEAWEDDVSEDGFKFKLILGDDEEPIDLGTELRSKRSQSDISLKIKKSESQIDDRSDTGLIKINFNDAEPEKKLSDNTEKDYNPNDSMKISLNFNMNDELELIEPSKLAEESKSLSGSKRSQNKKRKKNKKDKRNGSISNSNSRSKQRSGNVDSNTSQNEGKDR
jgi:hypothetical protein